MAGLTLLYSPFPSLESARAAAVTLLESKLVACCNLIPNIESHYHWEGKLTKSDEIILIAKTTPALAADAARRLSELHPYACPAILTLAADANAPFEAWVAAQTAD